MKKNDKLFRNGLLNENRILMIKKIADLIKNNKGKTASLNYDEII